MQMKDLSVDGKEGAIQLMGQHVVCHAGTFKMQIKKQKKRGSPPLLAQNWAVSSWINPYRTRMVQCTVWYSVIPCSINTCMPLTSTSPVQFNTVGMDCHSDPWQDVETIMFLPFQLNNPNCFSWVQIIPSNKSLLVKSSPSAVSTAVQPRHRTDICKVEGIKFS